MKSGPTTPKRESAKRPAVTEPAPVTVLHVPHASRVIPPNVRRSILLTDDELSAELRRMTDAFTDELFQLDPAVARAVVFPVSRVVVDPERFLDDATEPMAKRGMGVIYTRTSGGEVLRGTPDEATRRRLVESYYAPHHRELTAAVDSSLRNHDSCLVLDCHSFPSKPLPYEDDPAPDRPDICLGSDEFHSPAWLVSGAAARFRDAGFRVAIDSPFAGALVPASHYRSDRRVLALMIEVNRAAYMDEESGERLPAFARLATKLREVVVDVIELARTGDRRRVGR